MSKVRVLVGTRKGAFILSADGKREKWEVSGPHFAGWEIYHLKGSPADPNRIYASQTSGWFGQIIQRSEDGGKTWHQPGADPQQPPAPGTAAGVSNKFVYDATAETGKPLTTHQWYDGTQHPWEFKRVWHLEPSLKEPDTVYAGIEDAALFRSTDGGETWKELPGLRGSRGDVPAHDSSRSERSQANVYRHLRRGRVSHGRRRKILEADQSWIEIPIYSGPRRRGGTLRPPHRAAPFAPENTVHAKALGRDAQRQRRR